MNVSISSVAEVLGTTVSSVQSAIAVEAVVSAAFILINSKGGDLIGRRRAYVIGLVAYAFGALAMFSWAGRRLSSGSRQRVSTHRFRPVSKPLTESTAAALGWTVLPQ